MSKPTIRLLASGPEFEGQSWSAAERLRVGRVPGLEVVLEHPSVSRHHAELVLTEPGWVVRDMGSRNGTFLNGHRVGQAGRSVRAGDVVRFGRINATVSFPGQPEAARVTVVEPELVGQEGHDLFLQTVEALAQAVELRDKYTGGHTQRVTNYALLLADQLGLSAADRYLLQVGTPLHDVGKIGVDDAVLRKPGPLTPREQDMMRSHTERGAAILQGIPGLAAVLPIIRSHHEHYDGSGYPDGLAGEDIPLLARVVAVADAFDAMTADRPYRRVLPLARAFAELRQRAGSQFDPRCVEAFLELRPCLEDLFRQRQLTLGTTEHEALSDE